MTVPTANGAEAELSLKLATLTRKIAELERRVQEQEDVEEVRLLIDH
jgi:hypothetical protein